MKIGLTIENDKSISHLMPAVRGINNAIKTYFADLEYGDDVIEIIIGLILLNDSVTSKRFHPVRPFEYKRFDTEKSRITGQIYEIHKTATWDVKPDCAIFSSKSLEDARDYLCESLITSTSELEYYRNDYPNFDVTKFRADFEKCLREHCSSTKG